MMTSRTLTPRRRPIVAVISDGPEAVTVGRCAAMTATEQNRPVVLLVPMPRPSFTTDAVIALRMYQEAMREAEAIAARPRPTLDTAGVKAVTTRIAWYRPGRARSRARAVRAAAHRVDAVVMVTAVPGSRRSAVFDPAMRTVVPDVASRPAAPQ